MPHKDFKPLMKNCKALTYRLVLTICLFVISPLTMSAIAHEIRPAVADLSMTSAPPSADDKALPDQLFITIDLNAELFLAGLDASLVRDTDDAPQAKIMTRFAPLPPVNWRKNSPINGPTLKKP